MQRPKTHQTTHHKKTLSASNTTKPKALNFDKMKEIMTQQRKRTNSVGRAKNTDNVQKEKKKKSREE